MQDTGVFKNLVGLLPVTASKLKQVAGWNGELSRIAKFSQIFCLSVC